MARRRAEHRAEHRDLPRALRLHEQIGGCAPAATGTSVTGTFQQHEQRHSLGERELGDAIALRGAPAPDRAGEDGEVLGTDHHRTSVDPPRAGDDAIAGHITDQGADLAERAGIEQMIDAGPGVELALVALAGEALLPAHRACSGTALGEVVEGRTPTVEIVAHAGGLMSGMARSVWPPSTARC